ncbi:MAG: cytochrome c [Anaerolineales bacterium]|nr:MAG: cytochrome c [Anaerolineales bacterium]
MIANIRKLLLMLGLLLCAVLLSACGKGVGISDEPPGAVSDIPGEVPERYRALENPLVGDLEALERGNKAYTALCSQCHGVRGEGDGPEATGIDPGPGDLRRAGERGISDGYLYWRIADGGTFEPFNSLMPAWGGLLSDTEIWELVSFLRELNK